ncbi:hypothetical protein JTB14_011123 [Gonioctena quinquepunctata]|nr:hypothetical protein JTB14_011123 [Gonioctena quinquepunctata]
MFPTLQIQISNLDPHAQYSIFLEINPATHGRYKYTNPGGWTIAGTEEAQSSRTVYLHPDSPAAGEYWMSQPISFGRIKLTNTMHPPAGHLVLSSMHKYQPRIIITKTSDPRHMAWAPSSSVTFPETQFIAVTAYQNDKITLLKIDNNPFAKGFRENGLAKSKRKRQDSECKRKEEGASVKQAKMERVALLRVEDDRLSSSPYSAPSSSAPSSPEISHQAGAPQRRSSPSFAGCSYTHPNMLARPIPIMYPYYAYPGYSTPMWGICLAPTLCRSSSCSPSYGIRYPTVGRKVANEQPKRPPDFSIEALIGCS